MSDEVIKDMTGKELPPEYELMKEWADKAKAALGCDILLLTAAKLTKEGEGGRADYETAIALDGRKAEPYDVMRAAAAGADAITRALSEGKVTLSIVFPEGSFPVSSVIGKGVILAEHKG